MRRFNNAQEAFEYYYHVIVKEGAKLGDTKFLQNVGFYIDNPMDNHIKTMFRNWKVSYAETEWNWYLSENRSVSELKLKAKIWDNMHHGDDIVNSNYGYQWGRGKQLDFIVGELSRNPNSRRAVVTIYDGKEHREHAKDSPCTLNIVFSILNGKLNMSVLMRSNDLWFGFCNDQYCFSLLQELIAANLSIEIGWYYHFACNLHLYDKFLNK